MSYPGFPLVPPFAVTASYQNEQYGTGNSIYTPGVPSVFNYLVTPPTSGTTSENLQTTHAQAVSFTGNPAQNEIQTITIGGSPTGGTFGLLWGDQVTSNIAYNATAATVQTALNALSSVPAASGGTNAVQTVSFGGTPTGGTFTLTFSSQTTSAIAWNAPAATVQQALGALSSVGNGGATYAIQQLTISGAPTGGTFTLSFGGQTTSGIAYNATASTIQTALTGLSTIGSGNATVTGQVGGPFNVAFAGALIGAQPLITGNAASLTGGAGALNTVTAATTTAGISGTPNITVTGGPGPASYVLTFTGTLKAQPVSAVTAASSLTGTSPTVSVTQTTTGVLGTVAIGVSGSAGGPYTATFQGALANTNVFPIAATNLALTGGTNPSVTIATTQSGQPAFSDSSTNYWANNLALRNQIQQYDPQVYFYDAASGG